MFEKRHAAVDPDLVQSTDCTCPSGAPRRRNTICNGSEFEMRKIYLNSDDPDWIETYRKYIEASQMSVVAGLADPEEISPDTDLVVFDARELTLEATEIFVERMSRRALVLIVISVPRLPEETYVDAVGEIQLRLMEAGASDILFDEGHQQEFMARTRYVLRKLFKARILVVEDEPFWSDWVSDRCSEAGHLCVVVPNLKEAEEQFNSRPFDAMVIDRKLPDGDGLTFVKRLREAHILTPALIFSNFKEARQIVEGLGSGADDYIPKPANADEFVARLECAMRPFVISNTLIFGPLEIKGSDMIVRWRGTRINLGEQPLILLRYLAERADIELPIENICKDVLRKFMEKNNIDGKDRKEYYDYPRQLKSRISQVFSKAGVPDCIVAGNGTYTFDSSALQKLG